MTDNKKIYKQPAYRILNTRSKISLLSGSTTAGDDEKDAGGARQNDLFD